jgi:hypothetical protein
VVTRSWLHSWPYIWPHSWLPPLSSSALFFSELPPPWPRFLFPIVKRFVANSGKNSQMESNTFSSSERRRCVPALPDGEHKFGCTGVDGADQLCGQLFLPAVQPVDV